MKVANIDREILHNFWMTWGISMKYSAKMCLMIILKVTKNQGFTLCLEDTIFEKPEGGGSNWQSPSRFRVNGTYKTKQNFQNGIISELYTDDKKWKYSSNPNDIVKSA